MPKRYFHLREKRGEKDWSHSINDFRERVCYQSPFQLCLVQTSCMQITLFWVDNLVGPEWFISSLCWVKKLLDQILCPIHDEPITALCVELSNINVGKLEL